MTTPESEYRYSIQILLPETLDRRLRDWAEQAPGGTWPSWGGHITLVNRFVPNCHIETVEREVSDVCQAFSPFTLRLDQVICEPHWRYPHLRTVLLVAKERSNPGFATILRLRDALNAGLSPLKRDLLPEVSQRPFVPHVMLTRGISEAEATELAQHAAEAQLHIEFMVDRIHLLQFAGSEGDMAVCRYAGFSLGRPTIIPLPLEPVI